MIIQALNEEFEILHIRPVWQGYQIMQCRTTGRQEDFTMLHFVKEDYVRKLLPLFFSLKENVVYEDYKGCFTREEDLYVVFYKRGGIPLAKLLDDGALTLEQRTLIGKHILEKVLLWKLPDFLICQMLNTGRILIGNERIAFDYEWEFIDGNQPDMTMINEKIAALLKRLFQEEAQLPVSPGLVDLLEKLERDEPRDFFAIYEAYSRLYDIMPKEAEEYVPGIQRLKMKIQNGIQKFSGIFKIIVFAAVYFSAIFLLINGIRNKEADTQEEKGVIFERIGTLEIE